MRQDGSQQILRIRWAGVAALVIAAFFLGRYSMTVSPPLPPAPVGLRPEPKQLDEQWLEALPDFPTIRVRQPIPRDSRVFENGMRAIEDGMKASEWEHHRRFQPRVLDQDQPFNVEPRLGPDNSLDLQLLEESPSER